MLVWAVFEPTRTVIVFAPGGVALASAEAANVDLLEGTARLITVSGRAKGFVRQLYESGAWIVLPVTAGGCRSPRKDTYEASQRTDGMVIATITR